MTDRNLAICRAYKRGDKVADIAAQYGVHKWSVRYIARKAGLAVRASGRPRSYVWQD